MVILYPPYIEAKQNAFVYNEKGKIYFNTSILNSIDEVKFIQVIINRVDNNSNVLLLKSLGSCFTVIACKSTTQ